MLRGLSRRKCSNLLPFPDRIVEGNVQALLRVIRQAEGTEPNRRGIDPYTVVYGEAFELADMSRHPADPALGEKRWRGERLPDRYCRGAGLRPPCYSTAAGAYQLIWPTWHRMRERLRLPDFSAFSQDEAARELLEERGAVTLLSMGDIAGALRCASKEWASLPYSSAHQPRITMAAAIDLFRSAGGAQA